MKIVAPFLVRYAYEFLQVVLIDMAVTWYEATAEGRKAALAMRISFASTPAKSYAHIPRIILRNQTISRQPKYIHNKIVHFRIKGRYLNYS